MSYKVLYIFHINIEINIYINIHLRAKGYPFLKGVATRVTFTFKGGTLNFEASNLKAHLLNKEEK